MAEQNHPTNYNCPACPGALAAGYQQCQACGCSLIAQPQQVANQPPSPQPPPTSYNQPPPGNQSPQYPDQSHYQTTPPSRNKMPLIIGISIATLVAGGLILWLVMSGGDDTTPQSSNGGNTTSMSDDQETSDSTTNEASSSTDDTTPTTDDMTSTDNQSDTSETRSSTDNQPDTSGTPPSSSPTQGDYRMENTGDLEPVCTDQSFPSNATPTASGKLTVVFGQISPGRNTFGTRSLPSGSSLRVREYTTQAVDLVACVTYTDTEVFRVSCQIRGENFEYVGYKFNIAVYSLSSSSLLGQTQIEGPKDCPRFATVNRDNVSVSTSYDRQALENYINSLVD